LPDKYTAPGHLNISLLHVNFARRPLVKSFT